MRIALEKWDQGSLTGHGKAEKSKVLTTLFIHRLLSFSLSTSSKMCNAYRISKSSFYRPVGSIASQQQQHRKKLLSFCPARSWGGRQQHIYTWFFVIQKSCGPVYSDRLNVPPEKSKCFPFNTLQVLNQFCFFSPLST